MQVVVARIGKPHGIRGEVTVQLFTDAPQERFARGEVLGIENFKPGSAAASVAPTGELTVAGARWNKKILVVRFDEVTTRNQAEERRGSRLVYEVPEDEGDEEGFYEQELVNLPVYLLADVPEGESPVDNPAVGKPLGKGTGPQATGRMPVQDLLLIKLARSPRLASGAGEEIMIPFVEEIVPEVVPSTEDEPGFVLLTPPAGLIDLVEDAEQDSAQVTEHATEQAGE